MGLVSKSIPNLINGISQQPPSLRLESQGEIQENGLSDVVDGLKKRPPTKFLKKLKRTTNTWQSSTTSNTTQGNLTSSNTQNLTETDLQNAFVHTYKRSETEQYTIVVLKNIARTATGKVSSISLEEDDLVTDNASCYLRFDFIDKSIKVGDTVTISGVSGTSHDSDINGARVVTKKGLKYIKFDANANITSDFENVDATISYNTTVLLVYDINGNLQYESNKGNWNNDTAIETSSKTTSTSLEIDAIRQGTLNSSGTLVAGTRCVIYTQLKHGLRTGDSVTISGISSSVVTASNYNTTHTVIDYSKDSITISVASALIDADTDYTIAADAKIVCASYKRYFNLDNVDYLDVVDPSKNLTSTSVADYTFLVNKTKTVERSSYIPVPITSFSALVFLKAVNYNRNYKIKIESKNSTDKIELAAISGSGSPPSDAIDETSLRTGKITDQLKAGLFAASNIAGFSTTSTETDNIDRAENSNIIQTTFQARKQWFDFDDQYGWDGEYHGLWGDTHYYTLPANMSTTDATRLVVTAGGRNIPHNASSPTSWNHDLNISDAYGYQDYLEGNHTEGGTPFGWIWRKDRDGNIDRRSIAVPSIIFPETTIYGDGDGNWDEAYYYSIPEITVTYLPTSGANNWKVVPSPTGFNDECTFVVTSKANHSNNTEFDDFDISATDDDGGANLRVFKDKAQSFTDLPKSCSSGFKIKVGGSNNKSEDDYFVQFQGGEGGGYWKETVEDGISHSFLISTMPHTLKQKENTDGTTYFCFTQGSDALNNKWAERKAGNDELNPFPSFVGQKITDIFFHRNRLGIIAGENVLFSEAGNYFNFFRTTVRQVLDSDPIDVAVSQNEVSILKAGLPIQNNLLLFSELNQFTLSASQLLTPSEITIDQATSFECDLTATPAHVGNSVFFAQKGGNYSNIREYYTEGDTEIKDAALVTSHCPEYIKGRVTKLEGSTNEDILICQTDDDAKVLYVYKWYNQGNERVQSAWSKWIFDQDVKSFSFNNSNLYIIFANGTLEELSLRTDAPDVSYGSTFTNSFNASSVTNFSDKPVSELEGLGFSNTIGVYQGIGFVGTHIASLIANPKDNNTISSGTGNGLVADVSISVKDMPNATSFVLNGTTFSVTNSSDFHVETFTTNVVDYFRSSNNDFTTYRFRFKNNSARIAFFEGLSGTPAINFIFNYSEGITFGGKAHDILLDHRIKVDGSTIDSVSDLEAAVPFMDDNTEYISYNGEVLGKGQSAATKAAVVANMYAGGSIQQHDENGAAVNNYVHIGQPYTFKYGVSEQVFKPTQNDPTSIARFQLRSMTFNFNDTASFKVTQTSTQRLPVETTYAGRTVGSLTSFIGFSSVVPSDSYRIPIQSQASEVDITITNDTHLPCIFQSAEWEGFVVLRNQRI